MRGVPHPVVVEESGRRPDADPAALRDAIRCCTPADDVLLSWPALVDHLVAVGRTDAALAKLVEGHLDALRIHHEAASEPVPDAVYGVWASRSRGSGLAAQPDGDTWRLTGSLAFASGGGVVDRALIPVWPSDDVHVLLDVDVSGWVFDTSGWRTSAMRLSHTGSVRLDDAPVSARPVGGPSFYLDRAGFFPGGVGVAAVWAGGAARVLDLVEQATPAPRRTSGRSTRLGRIRTDVAVAVAVCRDWATSEPVAHDEVQLVTTLVRAAVAAAARRVLEEARAAAGAVGLATNEELIRAVDDLTVYLAQQDADKDAEWLGQS